MLLLEMRPQPMNRLIPLTGYRRQIAARLGNRIRLNRKATLPAHAAALNDTGTVQHVEVLGDRLPREFKTCRQLRNRIVLARIETPNQI